jgi:hypothetical protein
VLRSAQPCLSRRASSISAPGDTNINPDLGHFMGHYTMARRRFEKDTVEYIGDKLMPDEPIIQGRSPHQRPDRASSVRRRAATLIREQWQTQQPRP